MSEGKVREISRTTVVPDGNVGTANLAMLPVQMQFSQLSVSQNDTAVSVGKSLLDPNTSLDVKTRIPDSIGLTLVELLEKDARDEGFGEVADVYALVIGRYRANNCAEGGWMTENLKQILMADLERSRESGMNPLAKMMEKRS